MRLKAEELRGYRVLSLVFRDQLFGFPFQLAARRLCHYLEKSTWSASNGSWQQ